MVCLNHNKAKPFIVIMKYVGLEQFSTVLCPAYFALNSSNFKDTYIGVTMGQKMWDTIISIFVLLPLPAKYGSLIQLGNLQKRCELPIGGLWLKPCRNLILCVYSLISSDERYLIFAMLSSNLTCNKCDKKCGAH